MTAIALLGGVLVYALFIGARALVAALALPLAPYWGAKWGMRGRAAAWGLSALLYVALRLAAAR